MTGIVKKIHTYLGLLCFSILIVYGIAGLLVTFRPGPGQRRPPRGVMETVDFTVPPNLNDFEVAELAFKKLDLPLAPPPAKNQVRRDQHDNLGFRSFTANGLTLVTVLEDEQKLRVERRRTNIWAFLNSLHATTIRMRTTDWRVRAWAWYNEFAIWALLLMGVTGVWLWLASRPNHRVALVCLVVGSGTFLAFYLFGR
ncbi:MAG: hypothetical protein GY953_18110 [bacterium]|nr:hypothetical protein [bacterium]